MQRNRGPNDLIKSRVFGWYKYFFKKLDGREEQEDRELARGPREADLMHL